ncbi:lantibiotic dehydratase, partial [Streptomyces sp. NPDC059018]
MSTGKVGTTMPFMLRVAGLPVDSVRRLRCPASRRWADDVLTETERLAVEGTRLGGLLHGLIGHNEDESSRRLLLAVRRAVFNNRLPREAGRSRSPRGGPAPPAAGKAGLERGRRARRYG